MRKRFVSIAAACGLVLVAGCATVPQRPQITDAGIQPAELVPGDSALITVAFKDRFRLVRSVKGVVVEDPTIEFALKDDGVAPDARADDGIWSLQDDVPFNAPPGGFQLDLRAYDSQGNVIVVPHVNGEAQPLQASVTLAIRIPSAAAP